MERIGRLLKGEVAGLPPESEPETVEIWSRIMLQPGLELHLQLGRLELTP